MWYVYFLKLCNNDIYVGSTIYAAASNPTRTATFSPRKPSCR